MNISRRALIVLAVCLALVAVGSGLWIAGHRSEGTSPPAPTLAATPSDAPVADSPPSDSLEEPWPLTEVSMRLGSAAMASDAVELWLGPQEFAIPPSGDDSLVEVTTRQNATGIVRAVDSAGRTQALAPVLASSVFEWREQPIDERSTAIAKLLMTPGFATGEANADVFVVAAAYRSPRQLDAAAKALRAAAREANWFANGDSDAVRAAMRRLARAVEAELGAMAAAIGGQNSSGTGGARSASVGSVRAIDVPEPRVPCPPTPASIYRVVMPDGRDGDGACLIDITALPDGEISLTFENHSNRWLSVNARISQPGMAPEWAECSGSSPSRCTSLFVGPSAYSILSATGLAEAVVFALVASGGGAGTTTTAGLLEGFGKILGGLRDLDIQGVGEGITGLFLLPADATEAAIESAYASVLETYGRITNAVKTEFTVPAPALGQALVLDTVGWTVGGGERTDHPQVDPLREQVAQVLTLYSAFVSPAVAILTGSAGGVSEGPASLDTFGENAGSVNDVLGFLADPEVVNSLKEVSQIVKQLAGNEGGTPSLDDVLRLAEVVVPLMSMAFEADAASLLTGRLTSGRPAIAVIDAVADSINYMVGIAQWAFAMDEYSSSDIYTLLPADTVAVVPAVGDVQRLAAADPTVRGQDIGMVLPDGMTRVIGFSVESTGPRLVYGTASPASSGALCQVAAETGPGTGVMGPAVLVPCGPSRPSVSAADPCADASGSACVEVPMADVTGDGVVDRIAVGEPDGPCEGDPITQQLVLCRVELRVTDGPDRMLTSTAAAESLGTWTYLGAANIDDRPGRELAVGFSFGQSLPTLVFGGPLDGASSSLRAISAPQPFAPGVQSPDPAAAPASQTWEGPAATTSQGRGWRSAPGTIAFCDWASQGWDAGPYDIAVTRYRTDGAGSWTEIESVLETRGLRRGQTPPYCFGRWFDPSSLAPRSGVDAPVLSEQAATLLFDKLLIDGAWGFPSGERMLRSGCALITWDDAEQRWFVRGDPAAPKRCQRLQVPDFAVIVEYSDRGVLTYRYAWQDSSAALLLNP